MSEDGKAPDVLVVDDEAVVRSAARKVLESAGLRVATAPDADAALAHPALASCRLVLCDLVLPGDSGIDLAERLRRRRPELPVVLITGYATDEQRTRALNAGAAAFLAKPFDDSELLEVVREVLGASGPAAEEGRS